MIDTTALHSLALTLAPELAGRLEILERRPEWPVPPDVQAYCDYGRDLRIRAELKRLGRWQGAWPTTVVLCPPIPSGRDLLALFIHELGHALPARKMLPDVEPTIEQAIAQTSQLLAWANRPPSRDGDPWQGHDARYLRRVAHLTRRAELADIEIGVPVRGEDYGLSHFSDYRRTLSIEPEQRLGRTFAEIEATPMPAPFAELFALDCGNYIYRKTLMETPHD